MSAAKALNRFKQALTVDDGENVDAVANEFVDHTVAVEETFSHVRIGELRHDAPELGVRGQLVGEVEQTFDDLLGVIAGVAADVLGDTIDVIERLM